MAETETRCLQVSRRDWDVEMHVVFNAVQVNVGLTTVATVTACPLVLGCIPDFCVAYLIAMIAYRQFLCYYSLLILEDEKMNFITPCFWKLSCYINKLLRRMCLSTTNAGG